MKHLTVKKLQLEIGGRGRRRIIMAMCSVPKCDGVVHCRELCRKHYGRLQRHGDPQIVLHDFGEGKTQTERFWSKVNKDGPTQQHMDTACWEWTGLCFKTTGYGQVRFQNRTQATHRVAWYLTHGSWPEPLGLHTCDYRKCVNPSHLRAGTHMDNYKDMVNRGRRYFAKGSNAGGAKLTEVQVLQIRSDTRKQSDIAKDYSVHQATVSYIKSGRLWAHL